MINTGLDRTIITTLTKIFTEFNDIKRVKLYGSRAKGTFTQRSDINLVIYGENLNRFILSSLISELEESEIVYLIDVQNYSDFKNRELIDHIDRIGITIYSTLN
ncbi:MAG: nucleotidyltransferase domain-containing protein [Spirochaetaceae bacterium]